MDNKKTFIYFRDGELLFDSLSIRVYGLLKDDEIEGLFMDRDPGHTLITSSFDYDAYKGIVSEAISGSALELGLGLSFGSKAILDSEDIESLLTVEPDSNVIRACKDLDLLKDKRHSVLNYPISKYINNEKSKFDFILLNYFETIDEDNVASLKRLYDMSMDLLQDGGSIVFWKEDDFYDSYIFG